MKTTDFNYHLPPELIAQRPLSQRDSSRLLLLHRAENRIEHKQFTDILDYLQPGDVLVGNDSRVIPARLYGRKRTGGKVEILLLKPLSERRWQVLVGGKRLTEGTTIHVDDVLGGTSDIVGEITAVLDGPQREITFNQPIQTQLDVVGHTPLPPYIHEPLTDSERYQTVYARTEGSAAAPTAGLHFTPDLLLALRKKGVLFETCTLHIGLDTFKPVASENVAAHHIHQEWATLSTMAAKRINEAKLAGGRVIAVGTTAVRTLETAALRSAGVSGSLQHVSAAAERGEICPWRPVIAMNEATDLFIYPGYDFRVVNGLITNFHLPQSSLLMLVSALVGREQILRVYETAVSQRYRFYSFGDAMFIL